MFGTIRKHQTWLWVVIIIVIIIAFVWYFTPTGQNPLMGGGSANYGLVNGKIIDEGRYREAQKEVVLRFRFTYGDWPNNSRMLDMLNFNLQRETYFRVLLNEKIRELGIEVSDKAAGDVARALMTQSEMTFPDLRKLIEERAPLGMTMKDFDRFIRHEAAITELVSLVGLSGRLVGEKDAEEFYRFENQQVAAQAVFFSLSNHLDAVEITDDALATFFTNRMATYRVPERVQVRYVRFDFSNHLEQADELLGKMTNLNDVVETMYLSNRTNYFARGAKTEEEARAMVRDDLREDFAMREAWRRAAEFDDYLLDQDNPELSQFLERAEEHNLTVHTTTPFTRDYGPQDIDVPPDFTRVAFELSSQRPFGDLARGEDAIYVLAFDQRIPSEVPPFDEVRDKVAEDYRRTQAMMAAQQRGSQFRSTLTNELASGESFSEVARANGLTPVDLPLFSIHTQSLPEVQERVRIELLKNVAFSTPPGEASPFVPTSTGGMVLYVSSREPVSEEKLQAELPRFAQNIRQARQNSLFQNWIQQQLTTGYLQIPQSVMEQPQGAL